MLFRSRDVFNIINHEIFKDDFDSLINNDCILTIMKYSDSLLKCNKSSCKSILINEFTSFIDKYSEIHNESETIVE